MDIEKTEDVDLLHPLVFVSCENKITDLFYIAGAKKNLRGESMWTTKLYLIKMRNCIFISC